MFLVQFVQIVQSILACICLLAAATLSVKYAQEDRVQQRDGNGSLYLMLALVCFLFTLLSFFIMALEISELVLGLLSMN